MIIPQGDKQPPVTPFYMQPPQTPRTNYSQANDDPDKFKSPNSSMKELTQKLNDYSMTSPPKDELNTTINPQSKQSSKRK